MHKYNVGDKICFLYQNNPARMEVVGITISVNKHGTIVVYNLGQANVNGHFHTVYEKDAFTTFEALMIDLQERARNVSIT